MKKLTTKQRVQIKANPQFRGSVLRIDPDGQSGYVQLDNDEKDIPPTFFHISELEEDESAKPVR